MVAVSAGAPCPTLPDAHFGNDGRSSRGRPAARCYFEQGNTEAPSGAQEPSITDQENLLARPRTHVPHETWG